MQSRIMPERSGLSGETARTRFSGQTAVSNFPSDSASRECGMARGGMRDSNYSAIASSSNQNRRISGQQSDLC